MKDLRVLFAAADQGYRARLADAEGHSLGVEVPFTPGLSMVKDGDCGGHERNLPTISVIPVSGRVSEVP